MHTKIATRFGDPNFIDNPVAKLTSKEYAAQIRKSIHSDTATPSVDAAGRRRAREAGDDPLFDHRQGRQRGVDDLYGQRPLRRGHRAGHGLLPERRDGRLHREGRRAEPFGLVQGTRNSIAPGKRPLSSMAPTIVKKDGKVFMVVGSPVARVSSRSRCRRC